MVEPGHALTAVTRRYAERLSIARLHQPVFRARVLAAYQSRCAVCSLRHSELLDAAHILPDGHPRGLPVVPTASPLCKIHHAAYDTNIVGIRPDLVVEVRSDILEEVDGPMLRHGLQELSGVRLQVPPPDGLDQTASVSKSATRPVARCTPGCRSARTQSSASRDRSPVQPV